MATVATQPIDMKTAIAKVVDGHLLTDEQAASVMDIIMTGGATGAQIAALVTALRLRGETVDEIAGFASAMRGHALRVTVADGTGPLLDTCGTGGDSSGTFNISTTATFVIAAAGIKVAKHGNRAMTSKCGSADLLEGLGVRVELTPEQVRECIERVGIGFMYAPAFHPAMRFVGPTRREIGIRNVFNILGPLTNPAGAQHQLIGVGHPDIARKLAEALRKLGSEHAVLVHAEEGLDELGISGPTTVTEYDRRHGEIRTFTVTPEELGLTRGRPGDLAGGDAAQNVEITRSILQGEKGPRRDVVLLNAGAGIYAANAAESISEGIERAREVLDSGAAYQKVEELVALTTELASAQTTGVSA